MALICGTKWKDNILSGRVFTGSVTSLILVGVGVSARVGLVPTKSHTHA